MRLFGYGTVWSSASATSPELDDRVGVDWYTYRYTWVMATTIKVPTELRDRINRDALERGVTAAGFIEGLLDGYERRQRMESFGRKFRGVDESYWDEFRAWDVALSDANNGE